VASGCCIAKSCLRLSIQVQVPSLHPSLNIPSHSRVDQRQLSFKRAVGFELIDAIDQEKQWPPIQLPMPFLGISAFTMLIVIQPTP
jgi:hypothetical protein